MIPMDNPQQPTVGALLKSRRQELGLSHAEIASRTHIRRAYLEALEADLFEALPGEAYQSGFLRNYAAVLGLQPASVLRQWREQTARTDDGKRGELSVAHPLLNGVASPRRERRRLVLFLLPMLLVAAIALYFSAGSRRGAEAQVPPPATPALSRPADSVVPAPPIAATLPPAASTAEASTGAPEKQVAPEALALPALPAIPASGSVIRLEAMGPLTVEVAVDSRPLQRYVLSASSALQWNVGRSARLAVDNPAAVNVWLGGEPLDLAGRSEVLLQAAIPE